MLFIYTQRGWLILEVRVSPISAQEGPEGGAELSVYSFFNLSARWGGWSRPRHGRFIPEGETQYLLYRRLGGPQGPSGRVRKILFLTGITRTDQPEDAC